MESKAHIFELALGVAAAGLFHVRGKYHALPRFLLYLYTPSLLYTNNAMMMPPVARVWHEGQKAVKTNTHTGMTKLHICFVIHGLYILDNSIILVPSVALIAINGKSVY